MTRRLRYVGGALALAAAYLLIPAAAAAELAEPAGACVATGSWRAGGFTVVSTDADPAAVIEVPRRDQVSWTGEVIGPEPGEPREIAGHVRLQLPPPLSPVSIEHWGGPGVNVANTGVESYDLPGVVPAGVVFTLEAEHREAGGTFCTGTARLRIAGGPFDSPLIWVGLAGAALTGGLLLLIGRAAGGRGGPGRMAAAARAEGDDPAELRAALAVFHQLGARPAADRLIRRLRARGMRQLPRRPQRSTLANPGGLTDRQLEVLALLTAGLTNADIAARLHISPRTADHHVAAILAKLGTASRREAARAAQQWGWTGGADRLSSEDGSGPGRAR